MRSDRDTIAALIQAQGYELDRGQYVGDWPDDEKDLHRRPEWPSFGHRAAAMQEYRRTKLADSLIEAGWHPPTEVITTPVELDELQSTAVLAAAREHGYAITPAVIEDRHGDVYERDIDNTDSEVMGELPHAGWWKTGSERDDFDSSNIPLPVTVLRTPAPERPTP